MNSISASSPLAFVSTRRSATAKAAALAGSAAALATGDSQAAIVQASGLPLSISYNSPGPFTWDVDNNGQTDFQLRTRAAIYQSIVSGGGGFNGRGWANFNGTYPDSLQNLPTSFNVGPSLAAGAFWGANSALRTLISGQVFAPDADGFADGVDGYSGFRFTDAGGVNLYYGWARINFDLNTGQDTGFSILEAYYNDEPGAPIHVPDPVPEASTYGAGLLALGAVGLAAYRRRKAAPSAA